jgi:hypothetical protein
VSPDFDAAAMLLQDLIDQREAETDPATLRTVERFEDVAHVFRRDSGSAVRDDELDTFHSLAGRNSEPSSPTRPIATIFLNRMTGIVDEVENRVAHMFAVDIQG